MRYEPPDAECLIYTFKEGLLAAMAHDLVIRVTRFFVEVGRGATPLVARFDAGSLQVVAALSGGRPSGALSEADKRSIERNIADDVLEARRYPEIHFTARAITGAGERRRVDGTLSLHGQARAFGFEALRDAGDAGSPWRAEVHLHQPDYGIKPYSAMLGTLKIKPEVVVKISLPAEAASLTLDDEPPRAA